VLFAYTLRHLGLAEWRSPDATARLLMGLLAVCGIIGHLPFIKALELTPVSLLQL